MAVVAPAQVAPTLRNRARPRSADRIKATPPVLPRGRHCASESEVCREADWPWPAWAWAWGGRRQRRAKVGHSVALLVEAPVDSGSAADATPTPHNVDPLPLLRHAQRVEATGGRPGAAVRLFVLPVLCLFVCLFSPGRRTTPHKVWPRERRLRREGRAVGQPRVLGRPRCATSAPGLKELAAAGPVILHGTVLQAPSRA